MDSVDYVTIICIRFEMNPYFWGDCIERYRFLNNGNNIIVPNGWDPEIKIIIITQGNSNSLIHVVTGMYKDWLYYKIDNDCYR